MARDLTFTFYRSAKDTAGIPKTDSWGAFASGPFAKHAVRGKPEDSNNVEALDIAKDGPAVILAHIPPGKRRRASEVKLVHAIAADLEKLDDKGFHAAIDALAPFEFAAWTTHKSGAAALGGATRLRVVLPLAEPIEPAAYAEVWAGFQRLLGGRNDPATKDASRLHYLPSTFDAQHALAWRNQTARWLTAADLPAAPAPGSAAAPEDAKLMAEALRRRLYHVRKEDPIKKPAAALANGEPFAEPGKRHETILSLTWLIATWDAALPDAAIAELFAKSLHMMKLEHPDCEGPEAAVSAYRTAITKAKESQARKQEEINKEARGGEPPYGETELRGIAEAVRTDVSKLKHRWIIQRDGVAWFLTEGGKYEGAYSRDDAPAAAPKLLVRAPVKLVESTKDGWKWKPFVDIVRAHGTVARRVVSDLTLAGSYYDETTGTFFEAVAPLRKLEPEEDPRITEWIHLLNPQYAPKIIDWISCVPDLTKLLCAIYLEGPPGAGKTLFGHGLSALWSETATPGNIEEILTSFNEELVRCPLVLADEDIPKPRNRTTVTTFLREMLSTTSRTLRRKYRGPAELRGCVRLVLAANNDSLLDSRDVSTQADLEAIGQRFLYVQVAKEAVDYLKALPRKVKEHWKREGFARHALWLAKTHTVEEPGKRFWVEGETAAMHRLLMTGTYWNGKTCEWLTGYCMFPSNYDGDHTGLIRRGGGMLLVNVQALINRWDLYLKTSEDPNTAKIGTALRAISKGRRRLRFKGNRIWYYEIDMANLVAFSESSTIGDGKIIMAALEGPLEGEGFVDEGAETDEPGSIPPANGTPF